MNLSELQNASVWGWGGAYVKGSYARVVGSIMYAMVCTRPDIAQSVIVVVIAVSTTWQIPAKGIRKLLSGY